MLDYLQYRLLRILCPQSSALVDAPAYANKSKLKILLGEDLIRDLRGAVVADFGCGDGLEAIEMARSGAKQVIGIDIRQSALDSARQRASEAHVTNLVFADALCDPVDLVVCLDSFEHFQDPAAILSNIYDMLRPGGLLNLSFGPPWYHPLGGHLFSFAPWTHLLFSETALCRWRSHFRSDGAQRFCEVEGGLNQMTISRFRQIVTASDFQIEIFETVPVRGMALVHNRLTQEFTSALVRARLRRPRMPSRDAI